jgi:hypothetical protein
LCSFDLLTVSERLALGKFVAQRGESITSLANDFSFIPNFVASCNSPPAVIAATLPSLVGSKV